ncbi:MAG: hypothetical protein HZA05_00920, partial [Nitrospirae bacterium]|nr:hypothetical protein [Nitrospirota bacterium]
VNSMETISNVSKRTFESSRESMKTISQLASMTNRLNDAIGRFKTAKVLGARRAGAAITMGEETIMPQEEEVVLLTDEMRA